MAIRASYWTMSRGIGEICKDCGCYVTIDYWFVSGRSIESAVMDGSWLTRGKLICGACIQNYNQLVSTEVHTMVYGVSCTIFDTITLTQVREYYGHQLTMDRALPDTKL